MKTSFTIFELILTIILSSIVVIYSLTFSKQLFEKNKATYEMELGKVDLLSTKLFLQKNKKEIIKLTYLDEKLYFDENLLLDKIKFFKLENKNNTIYININYNDMIKQKWIF